MNVYECLGLKIAKHFRKPKSKGEKFKASKHEDRNNSSSKTHDSITMRILKKLWEDIYHSNIYDIRSKQGTGNLKHDFQIRKINR